MYFDQEATATEGTPTPPDLRVGDVLKLRTGIIVDRNGHPVPDGTLVQFTTSYLSEGPGFDVPQPEVRTAGGVARIDIPLNVPGQLQVKASSGDARASIGLAVTVFEDQPPIFEEITPVPTSTPTPDPPTPSITPTPEPPTPSHTPTPTPTATPAPIAVPYYDVQPRIGFVQLAAALLGITIVAAGGMWFGQATRKHNLAWGIRLGLLTTVGGLLGYAYCALDLPGSDQVYDWIGRWYATALAWLAGLMTLVIGGAWMDRRPS